MNASKPHKTPRFETVLRALEKGQRDAAFLDGRDHDDQYWRNAKRQLNTLRRELRVAQDEREALRAVIEKGER